MKKIIKNSIFSLCCAVILPVLAYDKSIHSWDKNPKIIVNFNQNSSEYFMAYSWGIPPCAEPYHCEAAHDELDKIPVKFASDFFAEYFATPLKHFEVYKFLFYKAIPGDLPGCDIMQYPISNKDTLVINVTELGCNISSS